MYSFHSSLEEKNRLLYTLTMYGIETTVDRQNKKDRIREWIQSSAIIEEDEVGEKSESRVDSFDGEGGTEMSSSDSQPVPDVDSKSCSKKKSDTPEKPYPRKNPFVPQVWRRFTLISENVEWLFIVDLQVAEERNRVAKLENLFSEATDEVHQKTVTNSDEKNTKAHSSTTDTEKEFDAVKRYNVYEKSCICWDVMLICMD